MSDLLVRLRNPAWTHSEPSGRLEIHYGTAEADMKEAADELERKELSIAKLRAVLIQTRGRLIRCCDQRDLMTDEDAAAIKLADDALNTNEQQRERGS